MILDCELYPNSRKAAQVNARGGEGRRKLPYKNARHIFCLNTLKGQILASKVVPVLKFCSLIGTTVNPDIDFVWSPPQGVNGRSELTRLNRSLLWPNLDKSFGM